ncbi:Imidazolonepropionase [Arthrobotrys entomopaga]|nr:Imidazolonepropionase [Arthrobotrys entomopaga]
MAPPQQQLQSSHIADTLSSWEKYSLLMRDGTFALDGQSLDIASVVAAARDNIAPHTSPDPELTKRVDASVKTLHECLEKGVNTGFGGSADSRTNEVEKLQQSLLQLTQSGIYLKSDNCHDMPDCMPLSWVRASIITRCNHLLRGHSGVRMDVMNALLELLRNGLTPIIPLRGSISASGDLMPLSYIAAVLEGNPDIQVYHDCKPEPRIISAKDALSVAGLTAFTLGPKEGLGLTNGSSPSTAVGSLAVYDANRLLVLAQSLTAMTCEAMMGNAENYHEFAAAIRPHAGQIEIAANVRGMLAESKLVETSASKDHFRQGLFQDRYALRGAPQWLGPQLEDLLASAKQITIELNSTQDNPVIDSESGEIYYSCNFQAASVTSAMEKTRGALQMIGRLLFSFTSEMINPDLNKGLPPNLVADEPSLSFTMKGVDINMAAYLSELGYLTHSVTPHVQSAEMHNQPINSLALISARYTMQAVELVSMMSACSLYVACQALDLRVRDLTFLNLLDEEVKRATEGTLNQLGQEKIDSLQNELKKAIRRSWSGSSREDTHVRIRYLVDSMAPILMTTAFENPTKCSIATIKALQELVSQYATSSFQAVQKKSFHGELNTESYLGVTSKLLYNFVRKELEVPFHCGLAEHPSVEGKAVDALPARPRKTVGSWISIIFKAVVDGRIQKPLLGNHTGTNQED